jgi:tagatose 1,6-diphosphate aldolase
MEEFSQSRYGVDVLKVELPVNPAFIGNTTASVETEMAYSRQEAIEHLRNAVSAATKPFIFLSAGVSDEVFRNTLEMATEAGVQYAGVLCGRATWQGGIPVYAQQGVTALHDWLAEHGARNIQMINEVLVRSATPWWNVYGGKDNIEVIEPQLSYSTGADHA